MSLHRFFLAEDAPALARVGTGEAAHVPLAAADLHHLVHVLRARPGDRIAVVAADRTAYEVVIESVTPEAVLGVANVLEADASGPRVTLFQGLAKGAKLDLVVEKAVEAGVEAVVPLVFERSVVRLDDGKAQERGERLRRVARAAAAQSQRAFVPRVADPVTFAEAHDALRAVDVLLVAWEEAPDAPGIGAVLELAKATAETRVGIVVGPEGGLSAPEVDLLAGMAAIHVGLGKTILRTETAGILAAALCVYELGGLGGRSRG